MSGSKPKARVEAVSISKDKGVRKHNVSQAVFKKDHGIIGDAHAAGLRQVSLLAEESIKKMQAKGLKVKAGDFAENITTRGINLLSLGIGDKIRIGRSVLLEVSHIGKDCLKPCSIYYQAGECVMPKEGIFARVLEGGRIKQGDDISVHSKKACRVAILTISDRCSRGERRDLSGETIRDFCSGIGAEIVKYEIIPDDPEEIREKIIAYCDKLKADLVLTTGGTGLGPRDFTPEATRAVIQKEVPGIAEAIRASGLKFTKNAMLSRAISGIRAKSLVVNLPGSPKGVSESLEAVKESIIHAREMISGKGHE